MKNGNDFPLHLWSPPCVRQKAFVAIILPAKYELPELKGSTGWNDGPI